MTEMQLDKDQNYQSWLIKLKQAFSQRRMQAVVKVNQELLEFYWQLGGQILAKQQHSSWATACCPTALPWDHIDMFGDPVINPRGWELKLLKDIAKIQIGPFGTQLHKEDYVQDGIPLINPSHIKDSKVVPNFNLSVSPEKHADLTDYHLQVGDIMMGQRGEMGRCALITKREAGWLCGTGSLCIRPQTNGAQSYFLFKYLTGDYIKKYLEGESLGATMSNLNKAIVGNIRVPMPSLEVISKFQKLLNTDNLFREKISACDMSLFSPLSAKSFTGQL